jgi:hypothetical protein
MDGAPDERAQAFTGAYLFTVTQVREALNTQQHDAQRLRAHQAPIQRLLTSVNHVCRLFLRHMLSILRPFKIESRYHSGGSLQLLHREYQQPRFHLAGGDRRRN